jgi:hypothetical protein
MVVTRITFLIAANSEHTMRLWRSYARRSDSPHSGIPALRKPAK